MQRSLQWFWGSLIVAVFAICCAVAYVLRDSEVVTPEVQQQKWLEMKQRR